MYTYETQVFIGQNVVRRTWWKYCRALPIPVWRVQLYVHRKNTVVCPYYAHRKSTAVYLYEEYGCMPIWRVRRYAHMKSRTVCPYEEYGCMPIWRVRLYSHNNSILFLHINWCWASVFRKKNRSKPGLHRAVHRVDVPVPWYWYHGTTVPWYHSKSSYFGQTSVSTKLSFLHPPTQPPTHR